MKQSVKLSVALLVVGLCMSGTAAAHGARAGLASGGEYGSRLSGLSHPRPLGGKDAFSRGVDRRQAVQPHRIQTGRRSGELTHREGKRLRAEQYRISKLERRFRADRRLSRGERRVLHHRLDDASRHIYRDKHNHRFRARHHHHYRPGHGEIVGLWSNGLGLFWRD